MRLFIKLLNRKPVEHPMLEDNMLSAYPNIDLNNLPENWAEFVRVPKPRLGPYEVTECAYEWDGDVVKDVWYTHPMGPEEKAQKQDRVKKNYLEDGGYANWIFDEDTCTHKPPVPYPSDGGQYIWIQQAEMWVPLKKQIAAADVQPIPYPLDGKEYEFDLTNKCWVPKL
jgi:hypothetical protein